MNTDAAVSWQTPTGSTGSTMLGPYGQSLHGDVTPDLATATVGNLGLPTSGTTASGEVQVANATARPVAAGLTFGTPSPGVRVLSNGCTGQRLAPGDVCRVGVEVDVPTGGGSTFLFAVVPATTTGGVTLQLQLQGRRT